MNQNTSHAVMAQRNPVRVDDLDFFPSPPWSTRALCQQIIGVRGSDTCLEPACGQGHMAMTLSEYFKTLVANDIADYGYGGISDFIHDPQDEVDWVITNPPFKLAEQFVHKALAIARVGVAILERTVFLESVGRHKRLFTPAPPSIVAVFAERVPMVYGRLDRKAASATSYSWFVWLKQDTSRETELKWIEPCRAELERDSDYNNEGVTK